MKNKKISKTLSALCAALVLMMGLFVTAFAQGTEEPPAEDATNDKQCGRGGNRGQSGPDPGWQRRPGG